MIRSIPDRLAVVATALGPDPRAAPRLARLAGFKGLLFDAWTSSLNIPDLSGSGRKELRNLLASEDQQLVGLRADVGPKGFGPGADVDRQIERLDRAMEAAAGLAAPLLCVDVGPLPEPVTAPRSKPTIKPEEAGLIIIPTAGETPASIAGNEPRAHSPPVDPAFVSQVTSALIELGVRADRYRVTVAFSSGLSSFAALNEALASARCPWFGVDLDPVAILRDAWSADEVLSALGPLLRHVRARDASLGADRRTQPAVIGLGSTDWGELLASLDGAGYQGSVTVDPTELPDRVAAARTGASHLRRAAAQR
jgi:sugar phosphate isomerase/epimerase